MKKLLLLIVAVIFISTHAMAQTTPKEADPKDVESLDAIMKAVYDVISGDAGKLRDWDRFRSLFHKDARLIPRPRAHRRRHRSLPADGAGDFSPDASTVVASPVARIGTLRRENRGFPSRRSG